MRLHILALALLTIAGNAAEACQKGDLPCFCKEIGGTYRYGKPPIGNACRIFYQHQGRQRFVQVYLPKGYDGNSRYPLWVHLHGVFWNTMGGIGQLVGPVDGTDIIPTWDRTVSQFGNEAIIAYPQSTGNPGTGDPKLDEINGSPKYRQFWNIPFWRCSVGVCSDSSVDDIGFIEKVISDLPNQMAVRKQQVFLSGLSAGGMMVETLLCKSSLVPRIVTAAANILGGIGKDFSRSSSCQNSPPMAYLKLHGEKDPFITFDREILVDAVNFLSAIDAARLRGARNGCSQSHRGDWKFEGQLKCLDYCAKKAGAKTAQVCGVINVGHDTDHPWPGFVFQQAWRFFNQQSGWKQQRPSGSGGGRGGSGQVARSRSGN